MPLNLEKAEEHASDITSLEQKLTNSLEFAWETYDDARKALTHTLATDYFDFLQNARTERERTAWAIKYLQKHGFTRLELGTDSSQLKPGSKVFYINRHKNVAAIIIGNRSLNHGAHLIGSHIDTPRLDLKMRPLYEDKKTGLALWKTHYYGGIKKYQWATIPLHLTGVIIKKDGTTIHVDIGKDTADPVFTIPDILPHLAKNVQYKRKTGSVLKGEELNVLVGGLPYEGEDANDVKEKFKLKILQLFHEKYGITEADLQSAELNLVSGLPPRYVGMDKSLIGGAGHDDGVCSWIGLRALVDLKDVPDYTSIMTLFDKEEIGSNGNTGAQSAWIRFVMNDLLSRTGLSENLTNLHLTLSNSKMISADVGAAINPNFPSVHDEKNAAVLGKGLVVEKHTGARGKVGSSDAIAEYMAYIRNIFDEDKIPYQIVELGKVDEGGGGTIAKFFAQEFNCDVIDAGTPVINMHSPFEIVHVADLTSTYLAYRKFYEAQ